MVQTSSAERHFQLPRVKVGAFLKSRVLLTQGDVEETFLCAKTISTYPERNGERDGDPIADHVECSLNRNRFIVAVADGCSWGVRPQQAAAQATHAFNSYMETKHRKIKDTQDAGHYLYRAFCEAHSKIIEGKEDMWEAGTTTLLGGIMLELRQRKKSEPRWGFVCASVGDCKAYHLARDTREVTDITSGNRLLQKDAKDPGGRLGPYMDGGTPDLRNLQLYFVPCAEGDSILIVSDGVHDNLDPETMGKVPEDFGVTGKSWEDLDKQSAEEIKTKYRNKQIQDLIQKQRSPAAISAALTRYCAEVTKKAREFMQDNPLKIQPKDYVEYPGKMDHTTCLAFVVGRVDSLSIQSENEKDKKSSKYPKHRQRGVESSLDEEDGSNSGEKKHKKNHKRDNGIPLGKQEDSQDSESGTGVNE